MQTQHTSDDRRPWIDFNPLLQGNAEEIAARIVSLLPTAISPSPVAFASALKERLADAGYVTTRADDVGIQYVLLIVHDPVADAVVGLLKQRGPEFLIGKLTFPGGKPESGETPEQAATREFREEAGLSVPVGAWKFVCRSSVVMVLAATSADVLKAHQCDDEPVFVMSVPRQLEYAARSPALYVPDFIVLLQAALATLG